MAFNGSGVFVRVHDWTTDLANTVPVTASRQDAEDDGFATGLSNTICRDGQSTTTARIPFAAGLSAAAGTTASVSYAQTNDLNTGMYFPATDQWGLVAGGTATLTSTATALTATGTLTVSGAVTLSSTLEVAGAITLSTSDGAALGSATKMWSDLFLASGAVINFNNGDVTETHAANTLTWAGATSGYQFQDGPIRPVSNDGVALGASGVGFSDLFLASGGVINWAGNATLTHSAGLLALVGSLTASGTLGISGATTLSSTLAVTGALTANAAAGVTARNTAKAFVVFTTDGSGNITVEGSFNVASVTAATVNGASGFRVTFTNAMASDDYVALSQVNKSDSFTSTAVCASRKGDRTTALYDFATIIAGASTRNSLSVDCVFFENA